MINIMKMEGVIMFGKGIFPFKLHDSQNITILGVQSGLIPVSPLHV